MSKNILKFLSVGMLSTSIDLIIYFVLTYLNIGIIFSKLISITFACIFSFIINKNWTFNYKNKVDKVIVIKYVINQIFNISCNVITNTVFFYLTNIKFIAFVIATLFSTILNFCLQNYFVFKRK
ncbi:GtrA family protein [Clostridium botulinum]|nr:GtrA family protein [Clostridium botulinum]